jgi:hypothetical protein
VYGYCKVDKYKVASQGSTPRVPIYALGPHFLSGYSDIY